VGAVAAATDGDQRRQCRQRARQKRAAIPPQWTVPHGVIPRQSGAEEWFLVSSSAAITPATTAPPTTPQIHKWLESFDSSDRGAAVVSSVGMAADAPGSGAASASAAGAGLAAGSAGAGAAGGGAGAAGGGAAAVAGTG